MSTVGPPVAPSIIPQASETCLQQRKVNVPTSSDPDLIHVSRSREELLPIFVERDSHDSISVVKGFFHPIAVMNVDINVQHTCMPLQQLQDGNHNVVHVAKPRRLKLLGVMQPTRPVNSNVTALRV
jgi:hypothetical protein